MNPDPTPTPDEIAAADTAHNRAMQSEMSVHGERFEIRIAEREKCREEIAELFATANAPLHAEVEALKKERDELQNTLSVREDENEGLVDLLRAAKAEREQRFALETKLAEVTAELAQLKAWKAEALTVSNQLDLQGIAKELGLPLGCEIAPAVLTGIVGLKKERDRLQSLIDADPHALVSVTNRAVLIANAATGELTVLKKERDDTGKAFVLQSVELGRLTNQLTTLRKQVKAADGLTRALKIGQDIEHTADERGPCLCSQCEFVRAKRFALAQWEEAKS